jgi:hypothetical protein
MADLTELQSSDTVKLVGADSTGNESNFANVTPTGELKIVDAISGSGAEGAITLGTTAIEAKVGASALSNRKLLTVFNNSGNTIYWGRTSGVTTSSGTPIYEKQMVSFQALADAPIYIISSSSGTNVRITESA